MLLAYEDLVERVVGQNILVGVPTLDNVNGTSIDITLGSELLIEDYPKVVCPQCGTESRFTPGMLDRHLRDTTRYCINGSYKGHHCQYRGRVREWVTPVDFGKKEPLSMRKVSCQGGYILYPGEVCLAHSIEVFNLPHNITAEYRLKSSQGRVFLEHLHAGWCDPGWHGSQLTLEFVNMSKHHPIKLTAGMKCGQVMFYDHEEVPAENSYTVRGQYNDQQGATPSKGMR